ncbi:putative vitellogenin receptor [Nymphon striatum]|nr:putative vitellogenin receptor [Nymphon striatum]
MSTWTIVILLFSTYSSTLFGFSQDIENSCGKLQFKCHNGMCVSTLHVCDGRDDCGDYSDEVYCDGVKNFKDKNHKNCSNREFTCHDRLKCIPSNWVCDGISDCQDGSDEISNCHPLNCTGYPCQSTKECIPLKWHCDGVHDCKDNSDEIGCEVDIKSRCRSEEGRFLCDDDLCLPPASVCNNESDCFGSEDEGGVCHSATSNCKTATCGDKCMDTPSGPKCYCTLGYLLKDDGKTCEARDVQTHKEASSATCEKGFQLQDDKYRRGTKTASILTHILSKCSILGKKKHFQVLEGSSEFIDELAYNGIENNIYWVAKSTEHSTIKRKNPNSGHPQKTFLHKGLKRDVSTLPLYLSAVFLNDGIVTVLGLTDVEDLDVDWINKMLYFSDSEKENIISCKLDGSLVCYHYRKCQVILVDGGEFRPYDVTVFEDLLYWTDLKMNAVIQCNKFTGKEIMLVFKSSDRPLNIESVHPILYDSSISNPCISSGCSHMCLLTNSKNRHECVCPAGMYLDSDWKVLFGSNSLLKIKEQYIGPDVIIQRPFSHYGHQVGAIIFVKEEETFYISDLNRDLIYSINKSANERIIVDKHIDTVKGLAFDNIGHNIYWTDAALGTVQVVRSSGRSLKILYENLHRPTEIVLDSQNGIGYIIIDETVPKIVRINMAGLNTPNTIADNLARPRSLTLDPSSPLLFWVDQDSYKIEFFNYVTHKRGVFQEHITTPVSLTIGKHAVYWINKQNQINSATFKSVVNTETESVPEEFGISPVLISVVGTSFNLSERQCFKEGDPICQHLCLQTLDHCKCECPFGYKLDTDGSSCKEKQCNNAEFMCHISKVCIPKTWQCDGVDDCHDINSHDVSDEQNCLACFENEFTCNGTGKCIHTMWKCDGTEDCVDGSDENEEICQSSVTEKTKECDGFSCGQGQCIYSSWVCDFEKDCSNGADEENCEAVRCSNTTEFECSRGSCIPKDWVCDGSHDCLNDKDEENCCKYSSFYKQLSQNFLCTPKNQPCIIPGLTSTPPECSVTEFKCRDGFCIHPLLVCDKDLDCPDGSDEDDTLCGDHGVCPEDQWECSESSTCIRLSQHCDGKVDCEEGEDEIGCPGKNAEYSSCEHHEFKCDFHACIPDNWVCDKVADCEDESDESPETCKLNTTEPAYEVESTGCSPDQFQCVSGECIDKGYHCDGHADCEDYSDEGHQCKFNLNECEEWGHCSQLCVNTKGSFKCSCRPTFRLEPDGKRCRSEDSSEVMLLFAVKNEIRQTTRDGFMLSILHRLDESSTILDFCYDQIKSMLYVITSDLGHILAVDANGIETKIETKHQPTNLELDWLTGNLYYSTMNRQIRACNASGE